MIDRRGNKNMICIAVDDGHGKETAGKRTPRFADGSYMKENAFNAAVAELLMEMLKCCGFATLAVAPEDTDTPLSVRVKRANQAKADAYISIHANAFGNGWNDANGVESWIFDKSDAKTVRLGELVQKELIRATKRKDRGLKKSDSLYVLNSTKMPAVLVECGFMTNKEEAKLLLSEEYRKKCAEGICKALCAYFGVRYIQEQQEQQKQQEKEEEEEVKRYQKIEDLPYGKESIQKLVDDGVLSGDENGNLNLSEDMLRMFMILDRKNLL